MKKAIYLLSLSLVCVFFFSACSSGSPADVCKKSVKAIQSGDAKAFIDCLETKDGITSEQKSEMTAMFSSLIEKGKSEFEKKEGLKSIDVVSETISEDGESAEVVLKLTFGDGTDTENDYDLIKKDGDWKIQFRK